MGSAHWKTVIEQITTAEFLVLIRKHKNQKNWLTTLAVSEGYQLRRSRWIYFFALSTIYNTFQKVVTFDTERHEKISNVLQKKYSISHTKPRRKLK